MKSIVDWILAQFGHPELAQEYHFLYSLLAATVLLAALYTILSFIFNRKVADFNPHDKVVVV